MGDQPKKTPTLWTSIKPFVNGGASGMAATCVIQPIDMVKVRLQLGAQGSPITVARNIMKEEGVGALYRGLSAGLLRQATYTTARLGIFNYISEYLKEVNKGQPSPLWQKAAAGPPSAACQPAAEAWVQLNGVSATDGCPARMWDLSNSSESAAYIKSSRRPSHC